MTCTPPPCKLSKLRTQFYSAELGSKSLLARASTQAMSATVLSGLSPAAVQLKAELTDVMEFVLANELLPHVRITSAERWNGERCGPTALAWVRNLDDPTRSHAISLDPVTAGAVRADLPGTRAAMKDMASDPSQLDFARRATRETTLVLGDALALDLTRSLHTAIAMDTLMLVSAMLVHDLKSRMAVPRIDQPIWGEDAITDPHIEMPPSAAYPGGHAMQMGALNAMLSALMRGSAAEAGCKALLDQMTTQLKDDRRSFGVHTEPDNRDGWLLGEWLGQRAAAAGLDAEMHPRWAALWELASAEWNGAPPATSA